jgi:hypothetical protein
LRSHGKADGWTNMATRKTNVLEKVSNMLGSILELGVSIENIFDIGRKVYYRNPVLFCQNTRIMLPFAGKISASSRDFNNERTKSSLVGKAKDDFIEGLKVAKRAAFDPEINMAGNILSKYLLYYLLLVLT